MAADTTKKHFIRIRGANVNNLKNLSVDIPEWFSLPYPLPPKAALPLCPSERRAQFLVSNL